MSTITRAALATIVAVGLHAYTTTANAQTEAPAPLPAADAPADAAQAAAHDNAVVKAAFMRADANGDGRLTHDEAAMLPAVAEKFAQLDKDSDGTISTEEFMAGVTVRPSSPSPATGQ